MLMPLKKRGQAPQPKVPQLIVEHDRGPSDTYAALKRLVTLDFVAESERRTTPLFWLRRGAAAGTARPMRVSDYRATVQRFARLLGYTQMSEWGAHSTRIGGATDLAKT